MLALEQDLLPASLHVEDPNPEIDFAALNLTIAREPVRLARTAGVRTAAISSFGFGGTNAHVVIADPLPAAGTASRNTPASARSQAARLDATPATASAGLLLLSAASEKAQRALAQAHLEQLPAAGALELDRLAGALAHLREPLPERAVLLARNRDELSAQLQHLAAGVHDRGVVRGRSLARDAKLAFVFSGNGSQWAGMGRAARAANPSFRAKLAEIDAYFAEAAGWSLLAALNSDDLAAQLASTAVAQPLLFSIQVATAAALADWGLEPDAVLGHSVGEVAAAQVAGALSLKAAVGVILARSTHQEPARGGGAMAALRLGQEAARE